MFSALSEKKHAGMVMFFVPCRFSLQHQDNSIMIRVSHGKYTKKPAWQIQCWPGFSKSIQYFMVADWKMIYLCM